MTVRGRASQPLVVQVHDERGYTCTAQSAMPLIEAVKHPFTLERLREHLGRLGGTPYHLAALVNELDGPVIIPLSELNRLRRDLVRQLDGLRGRSRHWTLLPGSCSHAENHSIQATHPPPELIVLVRTLPQLEAALESEITTLYCEFEDPKKYRGAVERFRQWQCSKKNRDSSSLLVAPPRIFKMGEDWILKQVQSCEADGYLIRNYDHLQFFTNSQRVGDFSLNVANPWTADYFIKRYGLSRLTASYDLNITQLEALARSAPTEWFEVTIHQHMPMFHMEHCVFCAFLSTGTDFTNCGRPCDHHEVKLRDRVGMEHLLKADVGCRNTLFNARAQTGAEGVQRLLALGLRKFRIEFLNESPDQVSEVIQKYRQLLNHEISGAQLWKDLKLLNQLGVTRGQLHTTR
jgi:U32 family peptidase